MPVSASYMQDQCYDYFSSRNYIKGDFSFKLLKMHLLILKSNFRQGLNFHCCHWVNA